MKVLVTGGAGFIGSHFVEWTVNNRPDVELVVLDKLTYASVVGKHTVESLGVPLIVGDIADPDDVAKAANNVDVIVNFAAETHNDNSIDGPDIFFRTNVIGTLELVKYAAAHDIRFHQISTDEVFGDLPLDSAEKFTEESPYRPSSPYSASKAAADHIVRAWVRTYGLKATISNCSNNYGPRQHPEKLIPKTLELLTKGERPILYGNGENIRDWIHVEDHISGVWAVLDKGLIGETYLLGAECSLSNKQLLERLSQLIPSDTEVSPVFVTDRPGHDLRYAVDATKASRELQWSPERLGFDLEGILLPLPGGGADFHRIKEIHPPSSWQIGNLNHVGVFVSDISSAREFLESILDASEIVGPIFDPNQEVSILMFRRHEGLDIELIAGEGVRGMQRRYGQGMYHLCFECDDIERAAKELLRSGATPITDAKAAELFGGRKVQFFMTPAGIVEILQA